MCFVIHSVSKETERKSSPTYPNLGNVKLSSQRKVKSNLLNYKIGQKQSRENIMMAAALPLTLLVGVR